MDTLIWLPWKTGIAFAHRGRTLLVVKQAYNTVVEADGKTLQVRCLEGFFRVEVHVYTPEWVALANELLMCDQLNYSLDNPFCLPGMATKLLVMISKHVKSLANDWFPGIFITPPRPEIPHLHAMLEVLCGDRVNQTPGKNAYLVCSSTRSRTRSTASTLRTASSQLPVRRTWNAASMTRSESCTSLQTW